MLDVLSAEDVRRQDAACEARGIPTDALMGNAGFAVARATRRMLGSTYGRRVVVVCGKGNNAGDGVVAGRILATAGSNVTAVMVLGDELSPAAGHAFDLFPGRRVGVDALERELARTDVVIDSLFGVGLSREPEGAAGRAIDLLSSVGVPVLSVDVPSGVDADTGRVMGGRAVRAERTVTLGGLKPGLLFEPGRSLAGRVEVADIGIPEDLRASTTLALEASDVREAFPRRAGGINKRRAGTVLVVAGSRAMPGAAALAAAASVHGGAGLTIVATPESVLPALIARVPEATTIPLPETGEGTFDAKALELIRPRLGECHAVAIGPGLSTHPATLEAVRALIQEVDLPLVLDADALTAVAGTPDLLARRRSPAILTPHAGELSRLIERTVEDIEADRLGTSRRAAAGLASVVVLKGSGTVVAAPDGSAYITPTGGPGLAQGGTGDVLTGLTGALLAQEHRMGGGRSERVVAALAAWIHGRVGDIASERYAPHPANASMLIDLLPTVIHEVAG